MRFGLIHNMMLPLVWLVQQNITKFKGSNITQYLIHEGLDDVGHVSLLDDTKISPLVDPSDGVWLWVWCCCQGQLLN